jgi:hypothetical protein
MRVAVRDLALLVAVASGSADAFAGFAPAPTGLGLRSGVVAPQRALTTSRAATTWAVRGANGANGVAALSANLKNADKIGKIVPKTWKEGTDFTKASKVRPDATDDCFILLLCRPNRAVLRRILALPSSSMLRMTTLSL